MRTRIYLATPYTPLGIDNAEIASSIRTKRFQEVLKAQCILFRVGFDVYNPIGVSHMVRSLHADQLFTTWAFWFRVDKSFIEWCDEMWVLMVKGYEDSTGINDEKEYATSLSKKIREVPPPDDGLKDFAISVQRGLI